MHRHMILCLSVLNRYHISIHMLAINLQVSYTLFHIIRILNVEVIGGTAEAAGEERAWRRRWARTRATSSIMPKGLAT